MNLVVLFRSIEETAAAVIDLSQSRMTVMQEV
jgi:hypothetical protein